MRGVLLDPITGRPPAAPEPPVSAIDYSHAKPDGMSWLRRQRFMRRFDGPQVLRAWAPSESDHLLELLPDHIKRNLDRPYDPLTSPMNAAGWERVIRNVITDGAAITTATEAIMVPDYSIPASFMEPGRAIKYTLIGRVSSAVTTPGVITLAMRWGGVAGVVLATSGGFIPDVTAIATNLTFMVEWWIVCRTDGATGSFMTAGRVEMPDPNDATVADLVIEYNKRMAPAATMAAVTVDTTIDKLLSPTYDQSLTTGSCTTHIAILEAMN